MSSTGLIAWCNRLIKLGFYLLFGLVPLLLTPWNYELFEYNKMMAVYAIAAVVAASWIIKSIAQKEFRLAKTPLNIPIAVFLSSQLISSLFSIDPHVSWFGYYSRFNGGMFSVISYVLLYYAFLSNLGDLSGEETVLANKKRIAQANKNEWKQDSRSFAATIRFPFVINLLRVTLITATIVAIYGVLERLGIDKHLWVQDVQNRVFSTLGQPNWLAAYLVALIPIAWAIGIAKVEDRYNAIKPFSLSLFIYLLGSIVFFLVLLFTRSRSGLLGFAVSDVVFWGATLGMSLTRIKSESSKRIEANIRDHSRALFATHSRILFTLHVIFALVVFINGTGTPTLDKYVTLRGWQTLLGNVTMKQGSKEAIEVTPSAIVGPALEVGGTESGVIRKYVWQGAVNAWNSSWKTRLIGTGTETFAFAFYQFRPVGHNLTSEWDFLYNKAHNEYLNYLATTGILGLGSYLLFIGSFSYWFIKRYFDVRGEKLDNEVRGGIVGKNSKHQIISLQNPASHFPLLISLFAGWISILITNFFGFSVVTQQLFLFLFPALILVLSSKQFNNLTMKQLRLPRWIIFTPIIVGLYILIRIGSFWYADTRFAAGYRYQRAGLSDKAAPLLVQAVNLNWNEPFYHDELSASLAALSVVAAEANEATQAAELAKQALKEGDAALSISPRNINFWKSRTKVYYTLSSLDPAFNQAAIEALKQALILAPNDPKIYYNLAILEGREGNNDLAIAHLKKAIEIKFNYRDSYYALWVFYTEKKQTAGAKAILQDYLTKVDPNDKDFLERIKSE